MSSKNKKIEKLEMENRKLQEKLNNIYINYYLIKKTPILNNSNLDNIDWLNVHYY
jgi:hypothetical protein